MVMSVGEPAESMWLERNPALNRRCAGVPSWSPLISCTSPSPERMPAEHVCVLAIIEWSAIGRIVCNGRRSPVRACARGLRRRRARKTVHHVRTMLLHG
jgi:hypothetical protein